MSFADLVRGVRIAGGLSQADVASLSGVARPNVAAFETGRREPRWDTAVRVLHAAGAEVTLSERVSWSWTAGRRPYAVPSRLWRLPIERAVQTITPGVALWWSGPPRSFDLAVRGQRIRAYEVVLREGAPVDLESVVDGALLVDAWAELVVPAELRRAWQPLMDRALGERRLAS